MQYCIYLLALILIVNMANGYNILAISTFGGKSHKNVLDPVIEELATRGHKVVFFTNTRDTNKNPNVKEVFVEESTKIMGNDNVTFFKGTAQSEEFIEILFDVACNIINATFSYPDVADIIRNPRDSKTNAPKFDLLILDASYNDFGVALAHHIGVPVVLISPSVMFPHIGWAMNIPQPFSYVPAATLNYTAQMTFPQRALNAYNTGFFIYFMLNHIYPRYDSVIRKFIPNSPPLRELMNKVSFFITNDHLAVGPSVPTMPYYVQLGGIHCKPAKKLPQDLENFIQSAKDGVIYFSLGSFTKGAHMPEPMKDKIIKAFAQLPQKVLWKTEIPIEGASENVKFIKWAPQGDLLAHPNLKLFITHYGGLSTQEAVYHGCPVLGFPLSVDQWGYMANAVHLGFGDSLDWRTFTTEDLVHKIHLLLEDPSYRISAQRASKIFKDNREHPAKTAASWVEYVIRHNGAAHLKSGAEHLNLFQYFLLDILGVCIVVIFLVLAVLVVMVKRLVSLLTGTKESQKSRKQKKQ